MDKNTLNPNEKDLYLNIKNILDKARKITYTSINFEMVKAYWNIGRIIVENEQAGALRGKYGKAILKNISSRLQGEYGQGFDIRNLQQMKKFYTLFKNANALRSQLTWTHYRLLLKVKDEKARKWYIEETIRSHWSTRQLERQISTFYYQRLLSSQNKDVVIKEANNKLDKFIPEQFIKDPYVLDFLDLKNYPSLRESDLEKALINNLQDFLLELGRGFCFVGRQKLMRYEDEDFYIDLVFYHSILKCYVLIDLKIGKLNHQDIGQMDSYIRVFDDLYKNDDDNPTIGLLLCSLKNDAMAKYSILNDSNNLFASKYKINLPSTKEIEKQLIIQRQMILNNAKRLNDTKERRRDV